MKNEYFLDVLNDIDDSFLLEARPEGARNKKRTNRRKRLVAALIAVCMVLLSGSIGYAAGRQSNKNTETPPVSGEQVNGSADGQDTESTAKPYHGPTEENTGRVEVIFISKDEPYAVTVYDYKSQKDIKVNSADFQAFLYSIHPDEINGDFGSVIKRSIDYSGLPRSRYESDPIYSKTFSSMDEAKAFIGYDKLDVPFVPFDNIENIGMSYYFSDMTATYYSEGIYFGGMINVGAAGSIGNIEIRTSAHFRVNHYTDQLGQYGNGGFITNGSYDLSEFDTENGFHCAQGMVYNDDKQAVLGFLVKNNIFIVLLEYILLLINLCLIGLQIMDLMKRL